MTFCCASNGAIKNLKIAKKNINVFTIVFSIKSLFSQKLQIFLKHNIYFWILEVLPVISTTYLSV